MTNRDIYTLILAKTSRIVSDSRMVQKGDIFFALKGDNFDGNKFASDAIASGAIKAVIDDSAYKSEHTILVKNVLATLQDIARIHRQEFNIPVLAITGTNGKTTTKELIARVLSRKYKVHFTSGNLNNHIGVPLTLLGAPHDTTFLVVEMGANHRGEIAELCKIAMPDTGIITNIGKAHLEGFGSYKGIIEAKSELFHYLADNSGTIIYNDSNPLLKELAEAMHAIKVPYSCPEGELKLTGIKQNRYLSLNYLYEDIQLEINSSLSGIHNAENISAAIASGIHFGLDLKDIKEAIESYKPENNRSQLLETEKNLLFCDAYNANPDSMTLALDSFLESDAEMKTVVLGDMLELGEYALDEHSKLLERLIRIGDIDVLLVGPLFCEVAQGSRLMTFRDTDLLIDFLRKNPINNNFVLIKGSRGIALERIYPYL